MRRKFKISTDKRRFEAKTSSSSAPEEMSESCKDHKEKSLGFLSNGFIKLFINSKSILSLEQAAMLLSRNEEEHKLKTKVSKTRLTLVDKETL